MGRKGGNNCSLPRGRKGTTGRQTEIEKGDRDGEKWGDLWLLSLSFYLYPCHVTGRRTSGVYEQ